MIDKTRLGQDIIARQLNRRTLTDCELSEKQVICCFLVCLTKTKQSRCGALSFRPLNFNGRNVSVKLRSSKSLQPPSAEYNVRQE